MSAVDQAKSETAHPRSSFYERMFPNHSPEQVAVMFTLANLTLAWIAASFFAGAVDAMGFDFFGYAKVQDFIVPLVLLAGAGAQLSMPFLLLSFIPFVLLVRVAPKWIERAKGALAGNARAILCGMVLYFPIVLGYLVADVLGRVPLIDGGAVRVVGAGLPEETTMRCVARVGDSLCLEYLAEVKDKHARVVGMELLQRQVPMSAIDSIQYLPEETAGLRERLDEYR